MRWRARRDRLSSPPTGEAAFRSFRLRPVAALRRVKVALKTSDRKDWRAGDPSGRSLQAAPPAFPLRQAEMRICYEIPGDKMRWAFSPVLTISKHFHSTLREPLTS